MFRLPLRPPLREPLRDAFLRAGNISQAIRALFATGQQGAWYDPSDFSTLFQDSAGVTPVTAVEQPVGLMRDKSGRNNHASQITAASRPVVSARVNLLVKSEQFDDAAWVKQSGTVVTVNTTIAPDGTLTADNVAQTGNAIFQIVLFTATAGLFVTSSVYLRANSATTVTANYNGNLAAPNNTLGTTTFNVTTAWQRFTHSKAVGATDNGLYLLLNGTSGQDFQIWGAQFEPGAVAATRYQRVNTASDYDTAGSPMYDRLDGVDDSMSSATGGGGTAGFFFCQAVKPTGGAGLVRTLWSDTGANSGYRVQLDTLNQLSFSAGNGVAFTTIAAATATAVGTTHLLTVWDDGTNLNAQLGSGAVATIARPVVTAGTAGFTIGKDNGAATGFFTGNMYPEVYRQTSLTAAERAQAQAYVRSKAGL